MIREVTKKEQWTEKEEFWQSWEYGDFFKENGMSLQRYEVQLDNKFYQFQGIETKLPLGIKFFYIARVFLPEESFTEISEFFKKKGYSFLRIETLNTLDNLKISYKDVKNRQPQNTLILDLNKTEEELLQEMHSKTRYSIRLAKKKGVETKFEKNIEKYWSLNKDTNERNKISSHSKHYLEKLLKQDNVYQLNTYYNQEIISSTILITYADTLYYLFGASANRYRNVMAPYLNQWEAINFAKEKGCKKYDFWGIAPEIKENEKEVICHNNYCWNDKEPLSGVTKFKVGFGGKSKNYPKSKEIILQPSKYKLFYFLQKLRKKF